MTVTKAEKQAWRDTPWEGVNSVKQQASVVARTLGVSEHAVLVAAMADVTVPHGELVAFQRKEGLPPLLDDLPPV